MTCPQCRNELPAGAPFCPGCGYRFPAPAPGYGAAAAPAGAPGTGPDTESAPPQAVPYPAGPTPAPAQSYVVGPPPPAAPGPYGFYQAPGPYAQPAPSPYGVPPNPYGAPLPGGPPAGDPAFVLPAGLPSIDDICARGYQVQIGRWVAEGWQVVKPAYWGMVGFMILAFFMNYFSSYLLAGPLLAGMFLVPMRHLKGRPQEFGRFFDGFKAFLPLFLLSIVSGFIITAGLLFLLLPGIYLATAFVWAQLLIIDRGMDFWPAMGASLRVVNRNFFGTFGFVLVQGFLVMLGIIPCCLGLIFTVPWAYGMQIAAYRDIFGINPGTDRCGG